MPPKSIQKDSKKRQRIYLTLPDDITDDLHRWADVRGMTAAGLAGFFVMQAVEKARDNGLLPSRLTMESVIQRLERGEWVEDKDLTTLSHDTGIHIEVLKTIRQCLTKNGGRSDVHTH